MRKIVALLIGWFLILSPCAAQKSDPTYAINGVNVGVLNNTQLVIEPFSLWMWGPYQTPGFGGQTVAFTNTITIDLTTVGCNGMDQLQQGQTLASGQVLRSGQVAGQMPPDDTYKLWAFYNETTFDTCFIMTGSVDFAGIVKPVGYDFYREIMYGVTVYGGALLPSHISHWPMPRIDITPQIQVGPAFETAVTDFCVDLARLIPETMRFVNMRAVLTGTGNNFWLSPGGGTQFRKLFAYNGSDVKPGLWIRVQQTMPWLQSPPQPGFRSACVYVTFQPGTNGRLDLYFDGGNQTEVD